MIEIGVNDILAYQKHALHVFENLGYYLNRRKERIKEMVKIDPDFVKRSKKIVFFGKIVSEENGDFHEIKLLDKADGHDSVINSSILVHEQVLKMAGPVQTIIYPDYLDCITMPVQCVHCNKQLGFNDIGNIIRDGNCYAHIACNIEELNRKNHQRFTEALEPYGIVNCKMVENEYGSKEYRGDWFVFTLVNIGDVRIGWRKRVIDVRFINFNDARQSLGHWEHPQGNATVYENGFHCYVNLDIPSLQECIKSAIDHVSMKGN